VITVFRRPRRQVALLALLFLLVLALALGAYRSPRASIAAYVVMAFAVASFFGLLEALLTRVTLDHDELVIDRNFRRRRIAKGDIAAVSWERGVGVVLKTTAGAMMKLPDVGDSQSRANAIRAWLKRGSADAA